MGPEGWIKGVGWTISSGVASCSGAQAATSSIEQDISAVAETTYTLTYTLTSVTAGTITPYIGGTAGTTRSTNGTFVETITAADTGNLKLSADADFIGTVDNVSVIDASLSVIIQSSDDLSTWTTAKTFASVYGIAATRKMALDIGSCKRFLRVRGVIGGTSPSFAHDVSLVAYAQ